VTPNVGRPDRGRTGAVTGLADETSDIYGRTAAGNAAGGAGEHVLLDEERRPRRRKGARRMAVRTGWQGRFYEDFEVGDVYQHPLGRTICEADNTWFTLLTMNTNQAHFNAQVGESSEFGRMLVVSPLTIAIAMGQSVTDTSQNAFANLGVDELRLTAPVFVGDTIWSESIVLSMRESGSRPGAGIVSIKTRTLNQDATEVLSFKRAFYVHKRDAEAAASLFPQAATPLTVEDA
jgi:acyl dehydratase